MRKLAVYNKWEVLISYIPRTGLINDYGYDCGNIVYKLENGAVTVILSSNLYVDCMKPTIIMPRVRL